MGRQRALRGGVVAHNESVPHAQPARGDLEPALGVGCLEEGEEAGGAALVEEGEHLINPPHLHVCRRDGCVSQRGPAARLRRARLAELDDPVAHGGGEERLQREGDPAPASRREDPRLRRRPLALPRRRRVRRRGDVVGARSRSLASQLCVLWQRLAAAQPRGPRLVEAVQPLQRASEAQQRIAAPPPRPPDLRGLAQLLVGKCRLPQQPAVDGHSVLVEPFLERAQPKRSQRLEPLVAARGVHLAHASDAALHLALLAPAHEAVHRSERRRPRRERQRRVHVRDRELTLRREVAESEERDTAPPCPLSPLGRLVAEHHGARWHAAVVEHRASS
mmetsp:Transcript_27581/g.82388  ORF Transcript_27581/g.82388 Transcript_27581/m.82388 type:complete len:334 (-) Transcript_27581:281-1282(-)